MSLRHALLGQLAFRPYSGYDLTKHFAQTLGYVWPASHSQIYPELARLREHGLIREIEQGPRRRRVYEATDAGREEVRRWLRTDPGRDVRSEAGLRIFFLWLLEPAEAVEYMRRELEFHRALLEEFEQIAEEQEPPRERKELAYRIALEAGIRIQRARVEWAEWAVDRLRRR